MPNAWKQYQEEAAQHFCSRGFSVQIEESLKGARGTHVIDVVVRFELGGVPVLWIIECKLWKSAIRKEQVMTLQQIAQDVGADRAFLLSESGFQSGALRAVRNTNVTLTSLSDLAEAAQEDLAIMKLREILKGKAQLEAQLGPFLPPASAAKPVIGSADIDEVLTLLGACLEIGLVSNHAMANNYPISIAGLLSPDGRPDRFDNPGILIERLSVEVEALRVRAQELEIIDPKAQKEFLDSLELYLGEIEKLLDRGAAAAQAREDGSREAILQECVLIMREIGARADQLRDKCRGDIRRALGALMRSLIDGAYLALGDATTDYKRWRVVTQETREASTTLQNVVKRHLDGSDR